MLQRERDRRIIRALRVRGTASAAELARQLGVSAATIRRDLQRLDRDGALTRVYGGAVLDGGRVLDDGTVEAPFEVSEGKEGRTKDALAALAVAELVRDGDVLLLDIGTTTLRVARHLRERDVTVITSSIAVFDELRDDPKVELVLLGGVVRRHYRSLVGSLTESALAQVSADRLFLSCTGIRRDGQVLDNMQVEAAGKQAMIAAAESVVLVAPPSKFPGKGSLRICGLADIDVLVTNEDADSETVEICRQAGGEVLTS